MKLICTFFVVFLKMKTFLFLAQEEKCGCCFCILKNSSLILPCRSVFLHCSSAESSLCVPSSAPYTLKALWFWSTVQLCGEPLLRRTRETEALYPSPHNTSHVITHRHASEKLHGFIGVYEDGSSSSLQYSTPAWVGCGSVQRRCCKAVFSHHCPRWVTPLVQMLPPQRLKAPDIFCTAPGHWGGTHMKEHECSHEHLHPVLENCLYIHEQKKKKWTHKVSI